MKVIHVKDLIILLLLSVSLFFSSINSLPVLDRDEARYVQSSNQMVENNIYLSRGNYYKYIFKRSKIFQRHL